MEKYTTSLELSKALKEAGVEQESSFYWINPNEFRIEDNKYVDNYVWRLCLNRKFSPEYVLHNNENLYSLDGYDNDLGDIDKYISAFLTDELMEMLPGSSVDIEIKPRKMDDVYWCDLYRNNENTGFFIGGEEKLPDCLAKMLLYLKKEGII